MTTVRALSRWWPTILPPTLPYTPYTDGRIMAAAAVAETPVQLPEPPSEALELTTSAPVITEEAPAAEPAMAGKEHVIASGDTLWDLAKTYYGDATMWSKIAEANPSARSRPI
jgi:5'-nucleotidase/UDP-sugar diphosphatase